MTRRLALLISLGIPLVLWFPRPATAWGWLAFCLAAWLLDTFLAPSPRLLKVTRELPFSMRLHAKTPYRLTMHNPSKRRYRLWLRDAWPPSLQVTPFQHKIELLAHSSATVTGVFTPQRRGTLVSDSVTLRSLGPLGLGARQFTAPLQQSVQVLPEFLSAKYLPSRLKTLVRLEGNALLMQRGQGSEFDSLREYVPGDDVRDIEWHVSAHSRTPVVKTWRPERDRNVVICLDSSRTASSRLEEYPRLDALMEAALLLGSLASNVGDRVQLITFDNRIRHHIQATRGPSFISQMSTALSRVEPSLTEANWASLEKLLLSTVRQRALVVLLTGIESGSADSPLMPTIMSLSKYHHVLVASAIDSRVTALTQQHSNNAETFLAVSAMTDIMQRTLAADLLPLLGAQVLQASPEKLPPAIADSYIALKRQGKL